MANEILIVVSILPVAWIEFFRMTESASTQQLRTILFREKKTTNVTFVGHASQSFNCWCQVSVVLICISLASVLFCV